ncbi:MAG: SH3 domain-containing protein [Chloroflexota bacterium]|nr:SH3 domain-containing protein [Chloroflexota bacterium]
MRTQLSAAGLRPALSHAPVVAVAKRLMRVVASAIVVAAIVAGGLPRMVHAESQYALPWAAETSQSAQESGVLAIVGAGEASLYEAPGGELIRVLPAGTVLTAVGRSSDSLWVLVVTNDDKAGWAETAQVVMFGADQLPVMMGEAAAGAPAAGEAESAPVALPTPTSTPLATPTPTPSPTPTMTPTPLPTPTPTAAPPTPTPAASAARSGQVSQVAVVRAGGTQLLAVPDGDSLQELATGTALTVWGRSEDSRWLVALTAAGMGGWIEAAQVVAFNLEALPVVPVGSTATSLAVEPSVEATPGLSAEAPASADALPTPRVTAAVPAASAAAPAVDTGVRATVAITDSRLNVRSGPGTGYRIVAKAMPGETFAAAGRNADSSWIEIIGGDVGPDGGWVAAEFMQLSAPVERLPVTSLEMDADDEESAQESETMTAPLAAPPLPTVRTASAPASSGGLAGNLVIQSSPGGEIYVADPASGVVRLLTSGFDPSVSPDGRTVAFTRANGDHGLYLIDIDGSNERRIYLSGERLRSPAWSPDGSYVVFSRRSGEYECRDVGFGICLPDNPFLDSFPMATMPEFGLSRVNVNGEEFRDLPALTSAVAPSWSDGGGIVYQSVSGLEITYDEPGARTQMLINAPYYQDPSWQPGGDRIVFHSREGNHWEIFTVNADGTGLSALTRPVTTLVDELPSNVAPAWSPDGQWIVYLSNRDDNNSAGDWRVWVMRADGSDQRPLGLGMPLAYDFAAEQVVDWGVKPAG